MAQSDHIGPPIFRRRLRRHRSTFSDAGSGPGPSLPQRHGSLPTPVYFPPPVCTSLRYTRRTVTTMHTTRRPTRWQAFRGFSSGFAKSSPLLHGDRITAATRRCSRRPPPGGPTLRQQPARAHTAGRACPSARSPGMGGRRSVSRPARTQQRNRTRSTLLSRSSPHVRHLRDRPCPPLSRSQTSHDTARGPGGPALRRPQSSTSS